MRKHSFVIFLFFILTSGFTNLSGQTEIKGKVLDSDSIGLPGALVWDKTTGNKTYSDANGEFSLFVGETSNKVYVRMADMMPASKQVNENEEITVVLLEDVTGLFKKLHSGISSDAQSQSVASIGVIDHKDLQKNYNTDPLTALQGRLPGINIVQSTGMPTAYADMRIRGISSILASNEPLIVIDGLPVENNTYNTGEFRLSALSEISSGDIASIEVLKDASSSALYGSRGANGVIFIKTKDGVKGSKKLNISYQNGFASDPTNMIEMLNGNQFMQTAQKAYNNVFPGATEPAPVNLHTYDGFYAYDYTNPETNTDFNANPSNTNWVEKITEPGGYNQINASVSGGDKKTTYYLSGLYRKDKFYLLGASFDKATARLKIDHEISRKLHTGFNVSGSHNFRDINKKDWFKMAHNESLPIYPVNSPNDPAVYWYSFDNETNPLMLDAYAYDQTRGLHTINTAYLSYNPTLNIEIRSEWGLSYQINHNEDYRHPFVFPNGGYKADYPHFYIPNNGIGFTSGNGIVVQNRYDRSNWHTNNYIKYSKNISGDHLLNISAGFSAQDVQSSGSTVFVEDLGLPFQHTSGQSNKAERVAALLSNYRFASFYGNAGYTFKNKYIINATVRADGSSRFGENNQMGIFPAAGIGWILSEEDFLAGVSMVSFAKIRASYGITGNANIGNYNRYSLSVPGYYDSPSYRSDGWYYYGDWLGYAPVSIANPDMQWEQVSQLDVGLDLGLAENRISVSIDYFMKTTDKLLTYVPLTQLAGYENPLQLINNGTLTNTGIEFTINTLNIKTSTGFRWNSQLNVTTLSNTIDDLPENAGGMTGLYNIATPGEAVATYFLPEWAGVDPETGHELIYDIETGDPIDAEVLTDEEFLSHRKVLSDKTPFPTLYGGLTNTLAFKGVELSFMFYMQSGNYMLDLGRRSMNYIGPGSTGSTDLLDGWTKDNPTDVPLIWNSAMASRATDRFLDDAGFIRLRHVSLAYNLPSEWIKRIGMSHAKIYIGGQNLLTITDYQGFDPEAWLTTYNSMDMLNGGYVGFNPPQARTLMAGIDISF